MAEAVVRPADPSAPLNVEPAGETSGECSCCGRTSHTMWGYVHQADGPTVAAYFVHWTDGHVEKAGVQINLVVGAWGEGASNADRATVSLVSRRMNGGAPSLTVVDAEPEPTVADHALTRSDVVGTSRAEYVLRIARAIHDQDRRLP